MLPTARTNSVQWMRQFGTLHPSCTQMHTNSYACQRGMQVRVWEGKYWLSCADAVAAWECVRSLGALRAGAATASSAEAKRVLASQYQQRAALELPARAVAKGPLIVPVSTLFVLVKRPSLSDMYQEYSDYYNHQLDKGWKS